MSSANQKYSEAIKRLEEILENIDRSNVDIDELAELAKEATDLIKTCRFVLKNTEKSVQEALSCLNDDTVTPCNS
ncbi:MAG: exodeoxyribonuclease VII small subunit [Fibromonadaceae bacterium]|jgi:exodeoxyribonuclease VII small subunit|nr:exodeoxyribonuclease VII small subunit [Fibromonadaceae bacterium]